MSGMSFDRARYCAGRQDTEMRGIAYYDGRLQSFSLPRASTAAAGDPAILCLRAVTTSLLAFLEDEAVLGILAYIIPRRLVNYDLGEQKVDLDGPILACIRQYVKAVAVEEDRNTLRKRIHEKADEEPPKLLSISKTQWDLENIQDTTDVPIIVGLLDWVLTSSVKRLGNCELTRSLIAWCLALTFSNLGLRFFHPYQFR